MSAGNSRRAFFRGLVGRLAEELPTPPSIALEPAPPPETETEPLTIPAASPRREVDAGELVGTANELGLGARLDALRTLSRRSLRLVDASPDDGAGSWLGGAPALPEGMPWPEWQEEPLSFLARIDLAEATAGGRHGPLPAGGALLVFFAADAVPSGLSLAHAGAAAVLHLEGDAPSPPPAGARVVRPAGELMLPRVWSASVQALDLDDAEQVAWEQLRQTIAERQGAPLADGDGQGLPGPLPAVHRLLGYPDERRGDMPLTCELAAAGIDLGEEPAAIHPAAADMEESARRWRLLLQLTIDDRLAWSWGDRRRRLYLWIRDDDLHVGDFSRVWAVPQ